MKPRYSDCLLISFLDLATAEEINAMIDVLDVNAFEIRGSNFSVRSVLPLTAMMNSVCSPNTQNCIAGEGEGFKYKAC